MKVENQIEDLKPKLDRLTKDYQEKIKALRKKLDNLIKESSEFDNNWVGEWGSNNYNLYRNFISTEANDIIKLTDKDISSFIESKTDTNIQEIKDEITSIDKAHREFQDTLLTELSVIKAQDKLESEIELLEKIESFKWGISLREYVSFKQPKNVFTYDPETLLNRGLETPPHILIGGKLMTLFTNLDAIENFQKLSKRLLRQLELKFSIDTSNYNDKSESLIKILNSFHRVARQLRNRYDNRSTLLIKDEYDVQDLLHSLLRIEFDDIRPEEWTPSYAGSSTRMDFLLKNEKTVIEVKKSRDGLKRKEVGEQLILDIEHYRTHPDCKRLICFVYDPDDLIENPRGLESDLNSKTNDDLLIEVFIRPK